MRSIWGYNCFSCGFSTASKGVAILFKNTFPYKIHNISKDEVGGSFLVLDISIFDERYTIANIYGPSDRDKPDFFENVFNIMNSFEQVVGRQVVVAGDWNVVLNPDIDTRNYRSYNPKPRSRRKIKEKMDELELVDIYRNVYPDKRIYTWRRFNSIIQSRLDFILVSDSLIDRVTHVGVVPGYRSDHSIVSVSIKNMNLLNKQKMYWKFNNSLLRDINFVTEIKEVILATKIQYSVPVYQKDEIINIPDDQIQFTINDQLFFEVLLLEIRAKTISYASYKKRHNEEEEKKILEEIDRLESLDYLDNNNMLKLEEQKLRLQEHREMKLRGMMIRSRVNWLQNGEKPTKYFAKLESRNFRAKRMAFLEKEDGSIIYEQDELLDETKQFYETLYHKRDTLSIDLDVLVNYQKKLTDNVKESLEGLITYREAGESLKDMSNNKSPGNSGFTVEFYKFFFTNIGQFLVRSINYGFLSNKLSITQRQGVITCLPKEGKNLQSLNNWRPISLLNVSYKIASSCISNRIKSTLHSLISDDQTGFQSGKFIGSNINLMYDILSYTETKNIPGMLVLVDFYKAFDSIAWDFIEQVLNFLNFGESIKKWVKLFYTDIQSCVTVNGKYSQYFEIQRGVRQGDPL